MVGLLFFYVTLTLQTFIWLDHLLVLVAADAAAGVGLNIVLFRT